MKVFSSLWFPKSLIGNPRNKGWGRKPSGVVQRITIAKQIGSGIMRGEDLGKNFGKEEKEVNRRSLFRMWGSTGELPGVKGWNEGGVP